MCLCELWEALAERSVWEVAIKTQSRDIRGGLMTLHGSVFGRTFQNGGWGAHIYSTYTQIHIHNSSNRYLTGFIVELGGFGVWF